jgi:putative FmdB family regulatory protein
MPIYEYECKKCGTIVEALQGINDAPLTECECGGQGTLERIISLSSFHLKGTGWYTTDYARRTRSEPDAVEPKESKGNGSGNGEQV